MGKTSIVEQEVIWHARQGRHVVFLTLEMTKPQLITRLVMREAGLTHLGVGGMYSSSLHPGLQTKIATVAADIIKLPISIIAPVDKSWPSARAAMAMAVDALESSGTKVHLVAFDHLAEVAFDSGGMRLDLAIGDAVKDMSDWSKARSIPFLLVHQLNRSVERENRYPCASDLRECGKLEEIALGIIMPWRPSVSGLEKPDIYTANNNRKYEKCNWIIAASRNGMAGTVPMVWDVNHMAYLEPFHAQGPSWTP
jgi:replicative DNA helicase